MRNRMIVAAALGLLPAFLTAQRPPTRIPTSIPREPRTSPGEPEPAPVARQLSYTRSHYWFESTAFASWINAPGFGSAAGPNGRNWSLTGTTTHAEYRASGPIAPTMDLAYAGFGDVTSSPFFPPNEIASMVSLEPGVRYRLRPFGENLDSFLGRFSPFIDVRGDYMRAYNSYFLLAGAGFAQQTIENSQTSWGFGGVAGLGTQIFLTPSWSLLTEYSTVANRMTIDAYGGAPYPASGNYWMHWHRLSLGINYNHTAYRELAQRAMR